jgi:hypothetical protein
VGGGQLQAVGEEGRGRHKGSSTGGGLAEGGSVTLFVCWELL